MSETPETPSQEKVTPENAAPKPASEPETGGDEVVQLPDDHPLVKTLEAQKEQIRKLKERAQKLDELEQEQMTEAEKTAARLKAAEDRAAELEAANGRKDVVIEFGLSKEDAEILEDITDIDAMKRIAERLAAASEPVKRSPKPHPAQMQGGDTPPEDDDAIARQFFGIK